MWKRIIFAIVICIALYGLFEFSFANRNKQIKEQADNELKQAGLELWYSEDRFSSYVSKAAEEFEKSQNIKVRLKLVSTDEYLNEIAKCSMNGDTQTPDLYIVGENLLEEAYTLGITSENTSKKYTKGNYSKTAINSVSYHDKMIAYPLSFHVSCMVYRSDLISQPKSIDEIVNMDITPFLEQGIEKNIDFNTSSNLIEYSFLGRKTDIGGEAGDNRDEYVLDDEAVVSAVEYFRNVITGIGIVPNAWENSIVFGFAQGHNLSLLLSSDYIPLLSSQSKEAKIQYSIVDFPGITEELQSGSCSYTDAVVVNGLSLNQETAKKFAEFLTYNFADNLYECTRLYPAYVKAGNKIDNYEELHDIYSNSRNFPKILELEDFSLKLRELFENTVNGQDINVISKEFVSGLRKRLEKE